MGNRAPPLFSLLFAAKLQQTGPVRRGISRLSKIETAGKQREVRTIPL